MRLSIAQAIAVVTAIVLSVAAASATIAHAASTHGYDYDRGEEPLSIEQPMRADGPADLLASRRAVQALQGGNGYDRLSNLARAFARPGEYRSAPNTAGSIRRVNPLGGTQNCVNCAIATDATLAGRPASALTSTGPQPISILERTFGGSFKPVSGADETQLLMDAGPGSRGLVFGSRGADPGHVVNAVNQRGVIRFLDGQSGGPASFETFDAFHFLRTDL